MNRYTSIMASLLGAIGAEVVSLDRRSLLARDIDCYLYNWFAVGDTSFSAGVLRPGVRLAYLVLTGKALVFVHHNIVPHDSRFPGWASSLQLACYFFAKVIIVHNQSDLLTLSRKFGSKVAFVPHPNYINEYGVLLEANVSKRKLRFCFLGQIRPYKNIEVLIGAFRLIPETEIELWILGKASSNQYAVSLVDAIGADARIKLVNQFIPDAEIPRILSEVDAIVLPYSTDSVSNSGAAILAISYRKPIILPLIPGVQDWPLAAELTYSYETATEHQEQLASRIQSVATLGREWLCSEGQKLRVYAQTKLSHSATALALSSVLKVIGTRNTIEVNQE